MGNLTKLFLDPRVDRAAYKAWLHKNKHKKPEDFWRSPTMPDRLRVIIASTPNFLPPQQVRSFVCLCKEKLERLLDEANHRVNDTLRYEGNYEAFLKYEKERARVESLLDKIRELLRDSDSCKLERKRFVTGAVNLLVEARCGGIQDMVENLRAGNEIFESLAQWLLYYTSPNQQNSKLSNA